MAIIGGLTIGTMTQTYQILSSLKKYYHKAADTIDSHIAQIVDGLKIHNEYFRQQWLFELLKSIISTIQYAGVNTHELAVVKKIFAKAVEKAKSIIGKEVFNNNIEFGETERILFLNEATANASRYTLAVSFDSDDYVDSFFSAANEKYIELNIRAARERKVEITRIFILDDSVLKNPEHSKYKKVLQLAKQFDEGRPHIKSYVLGKNSIPPDYKDYESSFFICDDTVASESESKSNKAYISMNMADIVRKLKIRFEAYLLNANKIAKKAN